MAMAPRPHHQYKREWLERILAAAPASVLDVGCGAGELIEAAARSGCATCVGLEADERLVTACTNRGLDVRAGRAESLPFADRSFDIVTLAYVTHHLEHLECSLLEAARVARRAVFVLDAWYDTTLPSQDVAAQFDDWSKVIDRRCGDIHNPCVSAGQLLAPLRALQDFRIDYSCRLIVQAMPLSQIETHACAQLARIDNDPQLRTELTQLLDRARLHGISEDGALALTATRDRC